MVSRETKAHVGAIVVAGLVFLGAVALGVGVDGGPATVAVLIAFYGIALAGGHAYLAVRSDEGEIPVESRWRYLAMLAVVFAGALLAVYGQSADSATLERAGLALAVLVVVVYAVVEARDSYHESRPG